MKINIVTEPLPGWVLRMMAENWNRYLPNCSITTMKPCLKSDINFYVNWDIFNQKTNLDIGWFTHRELDPKKKKDFDNKAKLIDYCICPSLNTLKLLPKEKSCVLKHGVGEEYANQRKKIKFGIIGRGYSSGRKNFKIVEKLKKIQNTEFIISEGKLTKNEVVDLYKRIDYLLVTSNNEGGPVPVIEALTMGVPIIAPNVGWCWEYPVIKYNSTEELFNVINKLSYYVDVDKVWQDSSKELLNIFEKIYSKNFSNKYGKTNDKLRIIAEEKNLLFLQSKKLEEEKSRLMEELEAMKKSRIWRYSSIFRKIIDFSKEHLN